MAGILPISAIGAEGAAPLLNQLGIATAAAPSPTPPTAPPSFASVLSAGLEGVDRKIAAADDLVRQFALDDSVPLHQVTFALEEARLSVELAMQLRARLVETYRDLMAMQL